jgi:hypothetical protein
LGPGFLKGDRHEASMSFEGCESALRFGEISPKKQ